jgi:hypothetical protein
VSAADPPDLARLRAALAASRGPDTAEADAARVYAAVHGTMSTDERQAAVDEMLTTADGVEVWALAKELAPTEMRSVAVPSSSAWRWLPLAATLAITIGGGWFVFKPAGSGETPAYRSIEGTAIASALPERTRLPRANAVLRWTPLEGARYRVRVLSPALEPIDEASNLTTAEYRVRPEVLQALAPGTMVFWQVEARIPGRAIVVSPTFSVQVE